MSTDLVSWLRSAFDDADRDADDVHDVSACASISADTADTFYGLGTGPCDCGLPEITLRTVAAHRAILARHAPDEAWIPPGCRACSQSEWGVDWPCADVLSIAAIFEDRPGFDPSWRVET